MTLLSLCFLLLDVGTSPIWPVGGMEEQVFGTYLYQILIVVYPKVTESLISSVIQQIAEIPDVTTQY